jgi:MFS family permease
MIPVAAAGIVVKRFATPLIRRVGYRHVLIANTVLAGLAICSFALVSPHHPFWVMLVQLAFLGAVNSLQFTAMNTLTLKDLEGVLASSGNSLLSMVMMLSISLGVAAAGALLATFAGLYDSVEGARLAAFQATFVSMGLITAASAAIFWQLPPEVPVSGKREEPIETEIA